MHAAFEEMARSRKVANSKIFLKGDYTYPPDHFWDVMQWLSPFPGVNSHPPLIKNSSV